ncbi:MAG: hypothetical protein ACYDEQ_02855 [Desulfocucumaceae bacterium]
MRKIFLHIIALIILICFVLPVYAQGQAELLEKAFSSDSSIYAINFFETWQNEYQPLTEKDLLKLSDTLKAVYTVFKEFYNPFDFSRIEHHSSMGSNWVGGNKNINDGVKYVVVSTKIMYGFVETFDKDTIVYYRMLKKYKNDTIKLRKSFDKYKKADPKIYHEFLSEENKQIFADSIIDFRPQVTFPAVKCLYLTDKYYKIINIFLGLPRKGCNDNDKIISEDKKMFINRYIRVSYDHWHLSWDIITEPIPYKIVFDKKMNNAALFFTFHYCGGEAYFEKVDSTWIYKKASVTWIQ